MGARHSAPARSDDGIAIQKQEEVFVVRYEKGVAYVRRWEDALEEQGTENQGSGSSSGRQMADHGKNGSLFSER
jgi:hypothetical protein